MRTVTLPDNTIVPALGQGTWLTFENTDKRYEQEKAALLAGIDAGMTLIDTAEMYGEGRTETLVGRAIQSIAREKLFLVSKVYSFNAGAHAIFTSCVNSLKRLQTDYLDLYLLHWRGSVPLAETVRGMEELRAQGLIRRWGISNFDVSDMEELWQVPMGENCAVNQVLYHVGSRGIEYDLLPWLQAHNVPLMAYCPLGHGGRRQQNLLQNNTLKGIAQAHNAGVAQILLAFVLRHGNTVAIPCSRQKQHTLENAAAAEIILSADDLAAIDAAFPPPKHQMPLDME